MSLTDIDIAIMNDVVSSFLELNQPASRKRLVLNYKNPQAIDSLERGGILSRADGDRYLPGAAAFHYCGDPGVQQRAKESLAAIVPILLILFEANPDGSEFTPADVLARWQPNYGPKSPEVVRLGLYLAARLGLLNSYSCNNQQTEIIFFRVAERIVTASDVGRIWEAQVSECILSFLTTKVQSSVREFGIKTPGRDTGEASGLSPINKKVELDTKGEEGIVVLISHSSKDSEIAKSLVDLLVAGLGLRISQIRCSSLDGCRLPAGADTDDQLREEVNSAEATIGLITPNSMKSPYVLFELGARWGAKRYMVPLLAAVDPRDLRGPLSGINALSCSNDAQVRQLVDDVRRQLNITCPHSPAFSSLVTQVVQTAHSLTLQQTSKKDSGDELFHAESVYWKRQPAGREGPYCPNCFEDKKKQIHLTPGATTGTYCCGICKNSFRTAE